ncbi:diaminobutyrate acetyltransferase [Rickettsiales bacterium]|nr:diaminobutyrate acetyltransferase [Rickettsiales bacterium]
MKADKQQNYTTKSINFDLPKVSDGSSIYNLIKSSGNLDVNSEYLYLLLCEHYSDTCSVAKSGDEIIGFTSAYFIPNQNDTLFIWQVAVSPDHRNQGIALKMIKDILNRDFCNNVKSVQATISPSNKASRALFKSLAYEFNTNICEKPFFDKNNFNNTHEDENLFTVGPLSSNQKQEVS